jgi:hypothetical protein
MKLEASLKHFSPQGLAITDSSKSTSPDRITGTDVMAALGSTSSRARFGLAAFLGKAGVSKSDEQQATQALYRYAMEAAPANLRKTAGNDFGWCMGILAQFAFAEYSRSAASSATCHSCNGTGFISRYEDVIKYPGIFSQEGDEIVPPKIKHELVEHACEKCSGKGELKARCRCGGKGEVLDRKATKAHGAPVFKTCERCSGNGFSAVSSATVHRAILKRLPDLHQSSWSRNWKSFYEALVEKCLHEEKKADIAFQNATLNG